jgi:hypothetical protein
VICALVMGSKLLPRRVFGRGDLLSGLTLRSKGSLKSDSLLRSCLFYFS